MVYIWDLNTLKRQALWIPNFLWAFYEWTASNASTTWFCVAAQISSLGLGSHLPSNRHILLMQ